MPEIIRLTASDCSVPVQILAMPKTEFNMGNSYLTHCKLKIFYIGETGDNRLFTKDFSEKLIETIYYTPVVGFYDEDDDDFKGHHHTQYVYGFVPKDANVSFLEEDGVTYAVTDVLLFTGRNDNIGDVAKKIIGMQHSLELDPSTVEYKINKDSNGNFKNIEFTNGDFIGLSVVGDSQKPAFSGSQFFTENSELKEKEEEIVAAFLKFYEEANAFFTQSQGDNGGVVMEKFLEKLSKEMPEAIVSYIKKTYQEKYAEVHSALESKFESYVMIQQMDDETVVFVDWNEGKVYRANYSSNEGEYEFGEKVEVKQRYLTDEEINNTFTITQEEQTAIENDRAELAELRTEKETFETQKTELETKTTELETKDTELEAKTVELETKEQEIVTLKERVDGFELKQKQEVLSEYTKYLTEEEVKNFEDKLTDYSEKELKSELALIAIEFIKAQELEQGNTNNIQFTNIPSGNGGNQEDGLTGLIDRYKDK